MMRIIDTESTRKALDFPSLVEALRAMFHKRCEAPLRHHHAVGKEDGDATLLLMPAWRSGEHIVVKIVAVLPDNGTRNLPSVMAQCLLLDGATGETIALVDGGTVTVRRTAAASALAADYLARPDASRLLMIGAGAMAPNLVRAHASVRPIREVMVWARNPAQAEALVGELAGDGFSTRAVRDRAEAAADADIISTATMSYEPLIEGAWLGPGTHVDLVGAFQSDMRESDDAVMRRGRVYVDTYEGAFSEAGDILRAMEAGALSKADIVGDLFGLVRGDVAGRESEAEVTVFKSVGTALEDLAATILAVERTSEATEAGE